MAEVRRWGRPAPPGHHGSAVALALSLLLLLPVASHGLDRGPIREGNQPPRAFDSEFYTVEDVVVGVTLEVTDSDGPGPYRIRFLEGPAMGELRRVAGATYDYVPEPGATGWDSFVWVVDDDADESEPATTQILVNGLPVATPQSGSVAVDGSLLLELDAVDDGWPEAPQFFIAQLPARGSLVQDPPGVYTYFPEPGFAGEDFFTWNFSDGVEDSETVRFDLVVNDPPEVADQGFLTDLDVPIVLVLDATDDGYPGQYAVDFVSSPAGVLTERSFGTYDYTPPAGWSGIDSFVWRMTDGLAWSAEATVTIAVNGPPVAVAQSDATNVDTALSGRLEWTDDGLPGGPLEIQITTQPFNGQLLIGQEFDSFTYTPDPGYTGSDKFRWRIGDGRLWSEVVDFQLQVNDPPRAFDQNALLARDTELTFELAYADDGFPGPYVFPHDDPVSGTLTEVETGIYTYSPDPSFSGYDSFVWSVDDGMAQSGQATVSFAVNAPPETRDQILFVDLDTPKTLVLDAQDDGIPGPLTFEILVEPDHGDLLELEPGVYTYTPDAGFIGTDDVKWRVSDGLETTPEARVLIGVQGEPELLIQPERLEVNQYMGEAQVTGRIQVLNPGVAPVDWIASGEAVAFQVSAEPASGTVRPESVIDVDITIELGDLEPGTYLGALSFRSPIDQSIHGVVDLALGVRIPDQERHEPGVVGVESWIPPDSRQRLARHLGFRPANGQVVELDPPRFSWPYESRIVQPWSSYLADNRYTLEVAADPEFSQVVLRVEDIPYNFHSFLPPLGGEGPWFWRVGYDIDLPDGTWSETRTFSVSPDAVTWDRSDFEEQLASLADHPRLFFDDATLPLLPALRDQDPRATELYSQMRGLVDAAKTSNWWNDFPTDDCPAGTDPGSPSCSYSYWSIGRALSAASFLHRVFGEESFDELKERFLLLASYPPGGWSSPEGLNPGNALKDPTHLTHMLALFYDWFHDVLSPGERGILLESLEWRIGHTLYDFAWTREFPDGPVVVFNSLSRIGWSHQFEEIMPVIIGSLAVYEDLPVAREALALGLHFVVAVTNSYGEDEAWNEGPGYGNDKMEILLEALYALDVALPGLDIWNIDSLPGYVDFFSRVTPLAAEHSSFGNRGYRRYDWLATRAQAMWLLAGGLGSEQAQANRDGTTLLMTLNNRSIAPDFPWLFYPLPVHYQDPLPAVETETAAVFPVEGWVTVSSAAPSDLLAQEDAVAMTFQARPRGGYGHSFASDNAFDLHAYGRTVAVGGGTTDNDLQFPIESISHNTVLVNGYGQDHDSYGYYDEGGLDEALRELSVPVRARVIAWEEGEVGGVPYVYWAGSAGNAYPEEAGLDRFVRHVVFVDQRWFVIYDDIRMQAGTRSQFDWLYHAVPGEAVPVTFDPNTFSFEYTVPVVPESPPTEVSVLVRHLAGVDNLSFRDLLGAEGQVNVRRCGLDPEPGTCEEDYRFEGTEGQDPVVDGHHLWVSTTNTSTAARFFSVIVPWRESTQARPEILAVNGSEKAVEVVFDGRTVTVSFDPLVSGDIRIHPDAITFRDGVPVGDPTGGPELSRRR